jgi:hypothetical protein
MREREGEKKANGCRMRNGGRIGLRVRPQERFWLALVALAGGLGKRELWGNDDIVAITRRMWRRDVYVYGQIFVKMITALRDGESEMEPAGSATRFAVGEPNRTRIVSSPFRVRCTAASRSLLSVKDDNGCYCWLYRRTCTRRPCAFVAAPLWLRLSWETICSSRVNASIQ